MNWHVQMEVTERDAAHEQQMHPLDILGSATEIMTDSKGLMGTSETGPQD